MHRDGIARPYPPPPMSVDWTILTSSEAGAPLEQSLALLALMRRRGVQPSKQTYSMACDACIGGGRGREARGLLRFMACDGLEPDVGLLLKVRCQSSKRFALGGGWLRLTVESEGRSGGVGRDVREGCIEWEGGVGFAGG